MNASYADIIDRIYEPPLWWDENAVPRYSIFTPHEASNIYADEVVLLRIRCQACHREFDVCMSKGHLDSGHPLAYLIRDSSIHYGDPPNIGCCDVGLAMNSEPLQVLQYWKQLDNDFVRLPELEVKIEDV